jgi:hypothetical protein
MPVCLVDTLVIAGLSAALALSPTARPQAPLAVTDPDAYTIYSTLLPATWRAVSKDALLLQQETEPTVRCASKPVPDAEWAAVEKTFRAENGRVQLLRPMLRLDTPYRFVSRADIAADDARLALKYPGQWQRRPGVIEYAAVSAVGFNANRTKAMVYVSLRSSGTLYWLEKRDGEWVQAHGGCGWFA